MENTTISPVYGRGRKKLIKDRSTTTTPTPGPTINARPTTENNSNVITVVDRNGNTDLLKTENTEQTDNQNEQNMRKSTRLKSTNPINRYGNPITFWLLQVTPLTNGATMTASREATEQRPEEMDLKNPEKEEEEDYTVETVNKTLPNIRTIRCYYYRLKFLFVIVILIYSYVYTCLYM